MRYKKNVILDLRGNGLSFRLIRRRKPERKRLSRGYSGDAGRGDGGAGGEGGR